MVVQREVTQELGIEMVFSKNQDGKVLARASIPAERLLEDYLDGQFILGKDNGELQASDLSNGLKRGDSMKIDNIRYSTTFVSDVYTDFENVCLSFDEYVSLGRPKKISVKKILDISPISNSSQ